MTDLVAAALAFGIVVAVAPVLLRVLRRIHVLDIPTVRSSHDQPTPRCGGLAPALGCVVGALAASRLAGAERDSLLVVAVGVGLIGLVDDVHSLRVAPRLFGQLLVAIVALAWLGRGLGGPVPVRLLAAGAIAVWLVGYINAFNFMDGINGLAVAQVIVAGTVWALIGFGHHAGALAAAGLVVAAAAAAFAPFNAPRAQMFLGDVGSYFLGGWLAVAAIIGIRAGVAPEAVMAPLAVFLADTAVTLVRRVRRRQAWSQPHREHTYQRLVQAGWSHGRTALSVAAVMVVVSALGALSLTGVPVLRAGGDLLALGVLGSYLRLPAWQALRAVPVVPAASTR